MDLDLYVSVEFTMFLKYSVSMNFSMNTRVATPPSTCRVFDFINVSIYFGLPTWFCLSFLNLWFSSKVIVSTNSPMNTRVPAPSSTCRVLDFVCVSLYFGLQIWICMYCLNLRGFLNLMLFINYPMNTRVLTFTLNVSCFGFHMRFPLLWLTGLDLYVFFWTYEFDQLSCFHINILWTLGFLPPPSTSRVFDFISVSQCLGLPIWICMSFLKLRFFQT